MTLKCYRRWNGRLGSYCNRYPFSCSDSNLCVWVEVKGTDPGKAFRRSQVMDPGKFNRIGENRKHIDIFSKIFLRIPSFIRAINLSRQPFSHAEFMVDLHYLAIQSYSDPVRGTVYS